MTSPPAVSRGEFSGRVAVPRVLDVLKRESADLSPNSARLLAENGFLYESSMSAQDFEPYWCRTGDVIEPDGVATLGPEIELLEIPFSWTLADLPQMGVRADPVRRAHRRAE